MTALRWSAQLPKRPGWHYVSTRIAGEARFVCPREVRRHDEVGLTIIPDPTFPAQSMSLAPWAKANQAWFSDRLPNPPEV